MKIGFFLALRHDPAHYLHAAALVRRCTVLMPGTEIVQFSDEQTPAVPGVTRVERKLGDLALLDLRLQHYGRLGEWLLIDTDVLVCADVRNVFDCGTFDVALCDRNWPHLPQGEKMLQEMPFNTGVCFSRRHGFWLEVHETWKAFDRTRRESWMSEQLAVYEVVRSGRYRVKILPGMVYNYPPQSADDIPDGAALVHFKGPRKAWLSAHATKILGQPVQQGALVTQ